MIKLIINGLMTLVISLVNVILAPIDLLIENSLPSLSNALDYISNFFDYIGGVVPWVISYTGISSEIISITIDLFAFVLSIPLVVHTVKLAISWYNKLKV